MRPEARAQAGSPSASTCPPGGGGVGYGRRRQVARAARHAVAGHAPPGHGGHQRTEQKCRRGPQEQPAGADRRREDHGDHQQRRHVEHRRAVHERQRPLHAQSAPADGAGHRHHACRAQVHHRPHPQPREDAPQAAGRTHGGGRARRAGPGTPRLCRRRRTRTPSRSPPGAGRWSRTATSAPGTWTPDRLRRRSPGSTPRWAPAPPPSRPAPCRAWAGG